jgi:hypothetical protein
MGQKSFGRFRIHFIFHGIHFMGSGCISFCRGSTYKMDPSKSKLGPQILHKGVANLVTQ